MFAIVTSILLISAPKTNILIENRERKVFEILEYLLLVTRKLQYAVFRATITYQVAFQII